MSLPRQPLLIFALAGAVGLGFASAARTEERQPGPGAAARPTAEGVPAAAQQEATLGAPAATSEAGTASSRSAGGRDAAEELAPGDIRVLAESYEQVAKGHLEARGFVDMRLAGMRVQADKADVFEDTLLDGTVRRRVVAEGNVVFIRGEERLAGDRLELDDTGHGFFYNAVGYVQPGVFVEATRVERVDADTYRVSGGRFSSCTQPNPRWNFSASRATIEVGDKIKARDAVFRVKGVPAFYAPYIYYPIREDGRSTGFLFPRFGHSDYLGYTLGAGFFWAMGRSADQTFFADNYSRFGYGFGHELRWSGRSQSRGVLRSYFLNATSIDQTDYDIDWNALQALPAKARLSLNVRRYSDLMFQQRFQEGFDQRSNRSERWSVALNRDFSFATASAYVDDTSTYFGTDYTHVEGRAPAVSLRRFPQQIPFGGLVLGFDAAAESLRRGDQEHVDTWARYDVSPTLSRPLRLSFLEFYPALRYRYTRYDSRLTTDADGKAIIGGAAIDRSFAQASFGVTGPTFARVFDTPGFGYSERFKHTIGPELNWTYRTRIDDFDAIPKFDGEDYYLGENQVQFALVQRLFAKRRGARGRLQPHELFSWRLAQTYYVRIKENQSSYDPNYSSSAFGPGFRPEHLSALSSRMRLRPTPDFAIDYRLEYDVNFEQVRRTGVNLDVGRPRLRVQGGWSRMMRLSEKPEERVVGSETVRAAAMLGLLPNRLDLEGSVDYDVKNDILYSMRAQARYSVQCCGFTVEHVRYNWNGVSDGVWSFSLELAHVGSVGKSMGSQMYGGGGRLGLGGYR